MSCVHEDGLNKEDLRGNRGVSVHRFGPGREQSGTRELEGRKAIQKGSTMCCRDVWMSGKRSRVMDLIILDDAEQESCHEVVAAQE